MSLDIVEIEKRISDSYELPNNVLEAIPAPVVTVRTSTYQHGPYIRDCIEGILAQQTDFPFEYIIGEDCSTDGTREIVFDYAERYPDIIRVVTADYNVGMKANGWRCIRRMRGRYIALCEGDDYWTDPLKLQKQVDFLEANPDYVLCHHDAMVIDSEGRVLKDSKLSDAYKRDFTAAEVVRNPYFVTGSVCFRNNLFETPPEAFQVFNGDTFLFSCLGLYGKAKYLGEEIKPSCYRIHAGGIWSQLDRVNRLQNASETYHQMSVYYRRIGKKQYANFCRAVSLSQKSEAYYHQGNIREGRRYLLQALAIRPWSLSLWRTLLSGF